MEKADTQSFDSARNTRGARALPSPFFLLAGAVVLCAALLLFPLTLPIGPMYWDLVVYVDGAQRVLTGQLPAVDFFAPVGPIAYWLMALATAAFPQGQPLLAVQWSLLLVTAPLIALVLWDVDRLSRPAAYALLLPFLAFQLMPMNVEQYSTFPSTDGYGIYNRHVVELLYVLTAALVFARAQRVLLAVIFGACLSLFLLKITGFLSAGLLCLFALLAGRVHLRTALAAAALFLLSLAALELTLAIVSAYVADILALVALNEGSLLPRFVHAASLHFGILAPAALLVAALLLIDRKSLVAPLRGSPDTPLAGRLAAVLDRPVLWLGVALAAGIVFETQNTGGQAFVFLWPVLLTVLRDGARPGPRSSVLVAALVAATAMPPLVNTLHRFSRAMVGQINYETLAHAHLGTLGAVTQRAEAIDRAEKALEVYALHPQTYEAFAARDMLPTWSLYSDLDFQLGWLMANDEAVTAILAYEGANAIRFETVMNLNFANPFPALLDRQATRHIAIGADPFRAVPEPDTQTLAAVAATDLILYPTCPITNANQRLRAIYAPAMGEHRPVVLSPCWIGYVRNWAFKEKGGMSPPFFDTPAIERSS